MKANLRALGCVCVTVDDLECGASSLHWDTLLTPRPLTEPNRPTLEPNKTMGNSLSQPAQSARGWLARIHPASLLLLCRLPDPLVSLLLNRCCPLIGLFRLFCDSPAPLARTTRPKFPCSSAGAASIPGCSCTRGWSFCEPWRPGCPCWAAACSHDPTTGPYRELAAALSGILTHCCRLH